jgi:branched-subunit amino acid transport protein
MSDVAVVILVAIGSYALRTSFIVGAGQRSLPPAMAGILDNVKPAALAALAATAAVSHDKVTPAHVLAVTVTGLAAYKGADLLGALILGMLALAGANIFL